MAKSESNTADVFVALGPELLFAALPFIVFAIVLWAKGDLGHFLYMPELSLASAVLLGQAIARFTAGALVVTRTIKKPRPEPVILFLTFANVLGLVPVLVVLVLTLMAPVPKTNLAWAQGILFIWTIVLYTVLAGVGQMMLAEEKA
jgi:hypothetical protein